FDALGQRDSKAAGQDKRSGRRFGEYIVLRIGRPWPRQRRGRLAQGPGYSVQPFLRRASKGAHDSGRGIGNGDENGGGLLMLLGAQLLGRRIGGGLILLGRLFFRLAALLFLSLDVFFQVIGKGGAKGRFGRGVERRTQECLARQPQRPRRDIEQ